MQQFISAIRDKRIILFGAGNAARTIFPKLNIDVSYFIDNDTNKWQSSFAGKPVKCPEELYKEIKGSFIVLIASMYYKEISVQLKGMGYKELYDYYNAFDLFINPLEYNEDLIVYEEVGRINDKIHNLLELGYYSDAWLLLLDYQHLAPFDERIEHYKNLIMLYMGRYDKVEQTICKSIKNSNNKQGYNYRFNNAIRYEKEKRFLDAIEVYEKLLAETFDNSIREELVRRINLIDIEKKDGIIEQLRERKYKINKSGLHNLHLLYDSMHSRSFIEFLNEYFNKEEHYFLVFYWGEDTVFVDEYSYNNVLAIRVQEHEAISKVVQLYLNRSKQVFIHYLHDFFCWLISRCDVNGIKLNWRLWGGDNYTEFRLYDTKTYSFLDNIKFFDRYFTRSTDKETEIQSIYRKAAIRKMSSIIVGIRGEYDDTVNNFVTSAEFIEAMNPLLVDFQMLDEAEGNKTSKFKGKYKYVILLGNSGDPSNNHLEVMYKLQDFMKESFCVITPLSYGYQSYIDYLIDEGKRILGDRFIPITEFMGQKEYAELLSSVDVAIMNHNRSQAMGNIIALLYLKKKVYVKSDINSVRTLHNYGLRLFYDFFSHEVSFDTMMRVEEDIGIINRNIVKEKFCKNTLIERYRKIFDSEND